VFNIKILDYTDEQASTQKRRVIMMIIDTLTYALLAAAIVTIITIVSLARQ